jgi:hypothetical protein
MKPAVADQSLKNAEAEEIRLFRPFGALSFLLYDPGAYAPGDILSSLRGYQHS